MGKFVKNMNHIPVQAHIYTANAGSSFRVRMTVRGNRFSKNFKSLQKARTFRKRLMEVREMV